MAAAREAGRTAAGNASTFPILWNSITGGVSKTPGQSGSGGTFVWGYDEITWFAHLSKEDRAQWLHYAWDWLKQTDPNGHLEMPGGRTETSPLDHCRWYSANNPSPAVPDGLGDEVAIREIWNSDRA
jgi:hypothetical protein